MRSLSISLLICLVALFVTYGLRLDIVEDAENRWLDFLFRWRGEVAADSRVIIVGINLETFDWAARPMFAWGPLYAEFVSAVSESSAAALLIDLIFSPSSETILRDHIRTLSTELEESVSQRLLRAIGFDRPFRAALMEMTGRGIPLILGFAWEEGQPVFSDPSMMHIARRENTGFFNIAASNDGVTRAIELFSRGEEDRVYAVSAVAARALVGDELQMPTEAMQLINFRGGRGTTQTLSLKKVIEDWRNGSLDRSQFAGKVVLLGFIDITDLKATPFGFMSGVEIHANIIDNILNERFINRLNIKHEALVLCLMIALLLAVAATGRMIAASITGVAVAIIWVMFSIAGFDSLYIAVVRPFLVLFTSSVATGLLAYRSIYLDRKRVKRIFSRYVSDVVLHEVLASSDQDFLRGTRRHLCVMMIDIRGFTSFSEARDARDIVTFLNAYFSKLTEIIMKHRGVVDKFLGDGLLAFFNAPLDDSDFAVNALDAALEVKSYVGSDEFKEITGGIELAVGIALHVGETVFGNIGSSRKAEFTVIGDTVNTCSRLEAMTKEFGVTLIVSGQFVAGCGKNINKWKHLGRRSLRGKTEEIDLYTVW